MGARRNEMKGKNWPGILYGKKMCGERDSKEHEPKMRKFEKFYIHHNYLKKRKRKRESIKDEQNKKFRRAVVLVGKELAGRYGRRREEGQ